MHKYGIKIISTGSSLPKLKISNDELSNIVDTSDDWIKSRTGIQERRIISKDESLLSLTTTAAELAISKANITASELDLIILATSTADDLFGTASKIQASIKADNATAFDLTAACSGFLIALITASQFIMTGAYKNILIVGGDTLSRWVDWNDRRTCVLFGDGAGAMLIQASDQNNLIDFYLRSNGKQNHFLNINEKKMDNLNFGDPQFFNKKSSYEYLSMNGQEVYKFAISKIPAIIMDCLNKNNITVQEVDWLLLHQANERILKTIADKIKLDYTKVLKNLNLYGNTSAASIPIMLDEAIQTERIKSNDLIVMSGFGAGLTWGVALIKWP